MNFSYGRQGSGTRLVGIAVVVLMHLLLIYALYHALGAQLVAMIEELPITVRLIETIKPPAPPAVKVPEQKVKQVARPENIIPKVEVPPQETKQASANEIQAVTNEQPTQPEVSPAPVAEAVTGPAIVHAVVDFSTCKKPDYPRSSLRNEEQGTVRIQFLIGTDGHVADSKIDQSSGFRMLDTAAKKALSLCKFKPGKIDGKPQESWTSVSYRWQLPD